jgi:acetyltransferase-like isoleucine patch superfamily enzyme
MPVEIIPVKVPGLWPITREAGSIKVAGAWIRDLILGRIPELPDNRSLRCRGDFLPTAEFAALVANGTGNCVVRDPSDGADLMELSIAGTSGAPTIIPIDPASFRLRHPWDLLALNEQLVGTLDANRIEGTVRAGATLDGFVRLGKRSVILPGVYIEGNVVIGEECKIGPNCYIRGNTSIGDRCHIGQAVEIKNSLLGDKVSVGHLSYAGDSVICDGVNFGAGTIISNLRHDGRNHRWLENQVFVDTGRRKFGAIVGENVHTGIHTAIYPGRSLSENSMTTPGEIVSHSK